MQVAGRRGVAAGLLLLLVYQAVGSPIKQTLTGGNTEYFPFNVIVPYKNQNEDSFVITMTIQDALIYGNTLGELSNFGTIVCTANDSSILPESLNGNIPFGSQTWIQSQNKVSNTLIVEFIDNTNSNFIKIIPGTKGYITPEYLLKLVRTAIEESNQSSYIPGELISMYRLGLMEKAPTLTLYLENNVPAILIQIPISIPKENIKTVMENSHSNKTITNPFESEDKDRKSVV